MVSYTNAIIRSLVVLAVVSACNPRTGSPLQPETQPAQRPIRDPQSPPPRPAVTPADKVGTRWTTDGWTVEPTAKGEVLVRYDHSDVATMRYIFFGKNWSWGGPKTTPGTPRGDAHRFEIAAAPMHTKLIGHAQPTDATTLGLSLQMTTSQPLTAIEGMGVEWRLALDSSVWTTPPTVRLTPDGTGFVLGDPVRGDLRVEVTGIEPRTYFERNDPSRVRILFAHGDVAAGSTSIQLRVTIPQPGHVLPTVGHRYRGRSSTWHSNALPWNAWPLDVRPLFADEIPAGKHGRITVRRDALVFEDGEPARFWGTNLAAKALFSASAETVERQAKRIAALGYNLVRIHHHDAGWLRHNVFAPGQGSSQTLDTSALRDLDRWVDALARQGVYTWLDLHVSRQFGPNDGIRGFSELQRTLKGAVKGFNYVNPDIERLMKQYAERFLNRTNDMRGHTWAEDPAIVAVLVTNENDLTDHFSMAMLPNKGNPQHQKMFEPLAKGIARDLSLPLPQSLRIWQPGPGKLLLAELQHRFDVRAMQHLRSLGVRAPIVTTSFWGREKLYSLLPLAYGDLIDVHSYGEAEELSRNPHHAATWLDFIAAAALVGKPLTVSEWNIPAPARDRFVAPLWLASVASLQGWDALLLYAYNHGPTEAPKRTDPWATWIDPALAGLAPAASIMFRRGDVNQATKTVVLQPTADDVYGTKRSEKNSAAIRTLTEQSRVVLALPDPKPITWLPRLDIPKNAIVVRDLDTDMLETDSQEIQSDTGQLRRSWATGIQTVNTARSQVAAGWLGGRRIALDDVVIELTTPKATVAFTSLDNAPLATSRRILVTAVGQSVADRSHYRSEPIAGRLSVKRNAMVLVPLLAQPNGGIRAQPIHPSSVEAGFSRFTLPIKPKTHWFLLVPKAQSASKRGIVRFEPQTASQTTRR